ncbi:helix-turn-helix domain-containing protein [Pseudodesulfovibrio pelocollis]|uniref:helix-turn-helix domain-containing protein n=1 Tax=Pseudodesulfovibrio pelocollis TaxID=3051432 RepID=UPI00255A832A|nr:helix-turn-helix domain-containing protein [Pseudodesulfovibrio sp. SB368]
MQRDRETDEAVVGRFEGAMGRIRQVFGVRTQVELAERLGVRQSSVSDAKRRCSIPAEWLLTIWRATGASPDWIMEGDACGHRYAVASTEPGQPINAVALRREIEAEVRAELDTLTMDQLIERLQDKRPDIEIRIPARTA